MSKSTKITPEEAEALLPPGEHVHTFMQGGPVLIGCDRSRKSILALFQKYAPQLSGETAARMKHGLVVVEDGPLFIETVPSELAKIEAKYSQPKSEAQPA